MTYGIYDATNDRWYAGNKLWGSDAKPYSSKIEASADLVKIKNETPLIGYAWLDRVTIKPLQEDGE